MVVSARPSANSSSALDDRFHSREGLLRFIKSLLQPLYSDRRLTKETFVAITKQTLGVIMSNHAYGGEAWSAQFVSSAVELQLGLLGIHHPFSTSSTPKLLTGREGAETRSGRQQQTSSARSPKQAATLSSAELQQQNQFRDAGADPIKNHLALLRHRLASKVAAYASSSTPAPSAADEGPVAPSGDNLIDRGEGKSKLHSSLMSHPGGSATSIGDREKQIRLSKQRMDDFYGSSTPQATHRREAGVEGGAWHEKEGRRADALHETDGPQQSTSSSGNELTMFHIGSDAENDHAVPSRTHHDSPAVLVAKALTAGSSPLPRTPPPAAFRQSSAVTNSSADLLVDLYSGVPRERINAVAGNRGMPQFLERVVAYRRAKEPHHRHGGAAEVGEEEVVLKNPHSGAVVESPLRTAPLQGAAKHQSATTPQIHRNLLASPPSPNQSSSVSPNSRSVQLMTASFLSSSKASQRDMLERVFASQISWMEQRRDVTNEETSSRQAVREEESAAFMLLVMAWAQITVALSLEAKHEKWQQEQLLLSKALLVKPEDSIAAASQEGNVVTIDLDDHRDKLVDHAHCTEDDDIVSQTSRASTAVPPPPTLPPPADQMIFLEGEQYEAEIAKRYGIVASAELLPQQQRQDELLSLMGRVNHKTQTLQKLQQQQQLHPRRSVLQQRQMQQKKVLMSMSNSSYARDHFRTLHADPLPHDEEATEIDEEGGGAPSPRRHAPHQVSYLTSPVRGGALTPKDKKRTPTRTPPPAALRRPSSTSTTHLGSGGLTSPRVMQPNAGTGPSRSQVVEFIRIVLQPLYNRGELDATVFSNIVRVVSREFFSRSWKSGSSELDAQWKHFLHARMSDLLGLRAPSL